MRFIFSNPRSDRFCALRELQEAGAIPTVEYLFRNCTPQDHFGFVPEDLVATSLANTVPVAMECRCFEDFDQRKSSQKTDFIRKWYHTRTKYPQISMEDFLKTLSEKDKQILSLRMAGTNLKTIREITDIQKLAPTLVNSLIERIEVHNSDRFTGKIRGNPQNFRFVS